MPVSGVPDDLSILGRKERSLVEQHLHGDESILFTLVGSGRQAVVALTDRLLIVKSGARAGAIGGGRVTSFPYADISGFQVHTGLIMGWIEVLAAGFSGRQSRGVMTRSKAEDPWTLPNCIPFEKHEVPNFQPYLDQLTDLVAKGKAPSHTPSPPATEPPVTDGVKTCPFCAETIKLAAVVCRYCGRDLPAS